jgi:hypothetical protein
MNLNVPSSVTVQQGGTLRAGTGDNLDRFGVGSATFAGGSTFAVTVVPPGTSTIASRLTTEGGGAASVNFAANAANPIKIRLEKEAGSPDFNPYQQCTFEIVHTNDQTGGSFPNLIRKQGGAFTFNAAEWVFESVGFDIVPGSASLSTDANQTILYVQFTVTPEPGTVLGFTALAGLLGAGGRRISRRIRGGRTASRPEIG